MKQRLIVIDLVLLASLVLLGWQLRQKYTRTKVHEAMVLTMKVPPAPVPALSPLHGFTPLDAADYRDAIAKNLFSQDRNPTPVPDPPLPPPPLLEQPPFPVAHGVMFLDGIPASIVLSSGPKGEQRTYRSGEKAGDWNINTIDHQYVLFEWQGQTFRKRIDDLMDRTPITAFGAELPAPVPMEMQKPTTSQNGHNPDLVREIAKACDADDKSPNGAVIDRKKKVVIKTPAGTICRWEALGG